MNNDTHVILPTTVTRELDHAATPLRQALLRADPLIAFWREQILGGLGPSGSRPPRPAMAGITGCALDHRLRWWFTGIDDIPGAVIAGLSYCSPATRERFVDRFIALRGVPAGHLGHELERAVCRLAVAAASIEPLYRTGGCCPCPYDGATGDDSFDTDHADVAADVADLAFWFGLTLRPLLPAHHVIAGAGASIGALSGEADVYVDGTLIEIKTTSDPKRQLIGALRQALVYSTLTQPTPTRLAIYLPRQRHLACVDLTGHTQLLHDIRNDIVVAYTANQRS